MQNRKSALRSHFVDAIDQFLEKLRRTVTCAARMNGGPQAASPQLLNGVLRSLEEDFGGLAKDWRDEQLVEVVDEVAECMLELSEELRARVARLGQRELGGPEPNGKPHRNGQRNKSR